MHRQNRRRQQRYFRGLGLVIGLGVIMLIVWWAVDQGLLFPSIAVPGMGTLEIRVQDHREAIADFARLELSLAAMRVKRRAGLRFWLSAWQSLQLSLATVDLTKYTESHSAVIYRQDMAPGTFEALDLQLKSIEGLLKEHRNSIAVESHIRPIWLTFAVRPNTETRLVVDLVVLDMRDHRSQGYELHIRGYELYIDGTLSEQIPPG